MLKKKEKIMILSHTAINFAKHRLYRYILKMFLLLPAISISSEFSAQVIGNFSEQSIFTNEQGGYTCYRIPAIIKAPNGDLLAFSEGRVGSCGDFAENDIVMKRSKDNGTSWSNLVVVCDNLTHNRVIVSNPAPVVDMTDPSNPNGVVRLVYNVSDWGEYTVMDGTGVREVFTRISIDNGLTWSTPENITLQVHRPNQPSINPLYNFDEDWRHNAITPGHAIQLEQGTRKGRLLFPANYTINVLGSHEGHSYAFYTDDHGATWHIGGIVEKGTNEAMAVEKTNGEILMTMRKQFHGPEGSALGASKYRAGVISSDEGVTFGAAFNDLELPDPVVQGSILRFTATGEYDKDRILIANPASDSSRENMTVRISYDEGDTWQVSKVVNSANSAYSDMVIDKNKNINLLYERSDPKGISLAQFDLEWLSDGNDNVNTLSQQDQSLINKKSIAYPVPADNYINVNLFTFEGSVDVNIYNIMGSLVKRLKLKRGIHKLDIRDFPKGTYILKVNSKKESNILKFIKSF